MTLTEIKAYLRQQAFPYYKELERKEEEKEQDQDLFIDTKPDWRDGVFRGILHAVSMEELSELVTWMEHNISCPRKLYYKAMGIQKSRLRAEVADIPTATLLRWYQDPKSRKRIFSCKALMDRFFSQNEETKRAILRTFLKVGGIKESDWAGRYLRDHWTKSMTTLVEVRWKKTPTPVLAQVILRHAPDSFVLGEQEELAYIAGYSSVCARLCDHKDFLIDTSRLSTPEHLYILAKSKKAHVDPAIIDLLLDEYLAGTDWPTDHDIGLVFWSLGKLGLSDAIINFKDRIEERLQKADDYHVGILFSE